ncbi:MAG: hypothetical protein JWN75_32 [Candidatus Saccharibacteria bacterium]|nr:hypothetical protein [Candidatus Saccharibacteria bacterium]
MQEVRIVVPNSSHIEQMVNELSRNEIGYGAPVSNPTVVRRLVRCLNKEYGVKLKGTDIERQNAFRIAGIVQARLFELQSEQEKNDPSRSVDAQDLAEAEVAKVIATALNTHYGLKLRPNGVRRVSVQQLCAKVVYIQGLRQ